MSANFSVVMTGKISVGYDMEQVKANVAELFKLDEEQVEKLFSGKPVVLKRGVERPQAMKIRNALAKAGALAVIKEEATAPVANASGKVAATAASTAVRAPAGPKPVQVAAKKPAAKPAVKEVAKDQAAAIKTTRPTSAKTVEKPQVVEPQKVATPKSAAATMAADLISCPRCAHEQPYATVCSLCKMDLQLHLMRIKKGARRRRR